MCVSTDEYWPQILSPQLVPEREQIKTLVSQVRDGHIRSFTIPKGHRYYRSNLRWLCYELKIDPKLIVRRSGSGGKLITMQS